MNNADIEQTIKVLQTGLIRRHGIRCDVEMCGELVVMLRELQKRREAENDGE